MFAVYYITNYFTRLLMLLKEFGYIFNFFHIPSVTFKKYLKFGYKKIFYDRIMLIFFSLLENKKLALNTLKVFSKPSRQLYLTYWALKNIIANKDSKYLYVLNTTKGILGHKKVLQNQIGGNLIFLVY
jgi:ribosomal protein S8